MAIGDLRSAVCRRRSGLDFFQHRKQLLHRGSISGVVAGIDKAEVALLIYDEVAAELTGVVTVGTVEVCPLQPAGEVEPYRARTF